MTCSECRMPQPYRPDWKGACLNMEQGCGGRVTPTIEEVCVIQGPGRGECWGCPVRDCVLWQNPLDSGSDATYETALRAAQKLASRSPVIQPATALAQISLEGAAAWLAIKASTVEALQALLVQMAAEAILQNTVRDVVVKRQRQYTDRWMKGLHGRMPTEADDKALDELMDVAAADAAADAYDTDPAAVLEQLRFFRNRRIVRRERD